MEIEEKDWIKMTSMGKRGFYHLFSDGFRTDCLFENRQAFTAGMNIVAICFLKCDISILAFCLMDNHVHFILYGTAEECELFRDKFIHKYSIWYSKRYSGKMLERMDFDIRLMEDEKYILNSIAYALRNGIAAGYCYCTEDYPWSSGGLYFRMPERIMEMTSGWKQISDITTRDKRRMFQTKADIPAGWKITPEGFIWPGNYIDFKMVEKLYRTPKSFTFFMGQSKEDEINRSLGISECIALPDMELREKTVTLCLRMFNTTDLRRLDVQKRITLGKELRRNYRCSAKQIARIIHLAPQYVKELV